MGEPQTDDAGAQPAWFDFGVAVLVRHVSRLAPSPADGPEEASAELDTRVDDARSALRSAATETSEFATVVANAHLGPHDVEVLALLAASEFDAYCHGLVAQMHPTSTSPRLTLGAVAAILGPGHLAGLAPDAQLRRCAFVGVETIGAWSDHQAGVHPTVMWALLGDRSPDPELPVGTELFDPDGVERRPETPRGRAQRVVVNGSDRMRRRQYGAEHSFGDRYLCADAPESAAGWAAIVREATITGRSVIVENAMRVPHDGHRWMDRASHLVWVISNPTGPEVDQLPRGDWLMVTAPSHEPTPAEWAAILGPDVERTHRLTFDQLHRVAKIARSATSKGAVDLDAAVRQLASAELDQLTRRFSPVRTWDDIVVGREQMELLRSLTDRYRHATQVYDDWGFSALPSRGVVALFSGPTGTGKTLASEIIAGDLGLDVFKLDLSAVVSKYIGETEKNLERVFDAAGAGNVVLFFDEADALFGKRSEVSDARDRYANIEVSYLLQRVENYDGLVILATNFEQNIDEAFQRRIHVRVAFTEPDAAERAAIWRSNLPAAAPVGELDIEWLAQQFELTGGAIRNASVQAAFVAAAAGTAIDMNAVVVGVAREFRKMGRRVQAKDFGDRLPAPADPANGAPLESPAQDPHRTAALRP